MGNAMHCMYTCVTAADVRLMYSSYPYEACTVVGASEVFLNDFFPSGENAVSWLWRFERTFVVCVSPRSKQPTSSRSVARWSVNPAGRARLFWRELEKRWFSRRCSYMRGHCCRAAKRISPHTAGVANGVASGMLRWITVSWFE